MDGGSDVVFLGSGTSMGTPSMDCMLGFAPDKQAQFGRGGCDVCRKARKGPPTMNRNNRLNPSIMIRYRGHPDGETRYIQIDAGKTFRESIDRWYMEYNIPRLDALILTHNHANATFGLDDVRMVQARGVPLPVYLSQDTFGRLKRSLGYLVRSKPHYVGALSNFQESSSSNEDDEDTIDTSITAKAYVTALDWNVMSGPSFDSNQLTPFKVCGVEITPFPVYHGGDYLSLGFMMGKCEKFVYISDCSRIPDAILKFLQEQNIELFVTEALSLEGVHRSHMNLLDALDLIREIRPLKAYLTGIGHDFDHDEANKDLARLRQSEGLDVSLAHDGLVLPIPEL